MTKKFIELVNATKSAGSSILLIDLEMAIEVKDYIEKSIEGLFEDEFRFAAEGMVAAFDDRPDSEPEDITKATREAALHNAKQILGWD